MIVDMHCHLDLYKNPREVAIECKKRSNYVLSVTTTPRAWEGTARLAEGNPRIRTALGMHPQVAHERYAEMDLFEYLLPKVKYVGEIGLDAGKGFSEHLERQVSVFREALRLTSLRGGRILSIHSRKASKEVLALLRQYPGAGTPILHWFTGSKTNLREAIDIGCWFSVGPAMLITKNGQELVKSMPIDRILPETDGPFGKYLGKVLFPWEANLVVDLVSEIREIPREECQAQVSYNVKNLVAR